MTIKKLLKINACNFSANYNRRKNGPSRLDYLSSTIEYDKECSACDIINLISHISFIPNSNGVSVPAQYYIHTEHKKYTDYACSLIDNHAHHIDTISMKKLIDDRIVCYSGIYKVRILKSIMKNINNISEESIVYLRKYGFTHNYDVNEYTGSMHFYHYCCYDINAIVTYLHKAKSQYGSVMTNKGFLNMYETLRNNNRLLNNTSFVDNVHTIVRAIPHNITFDIELFEIFHLNHDIKHKIDDIFDLYDIVLDREFFLDKRNEYSYKLIRTLLNSKYCEYNITDDVFVWIKDNEYKMHILNRMHKMDIKLMMHLFALGYFTYDSFVEYNNLWNNDKHKHRMILEISNSEYFIKSFLTSCTMSVKEYWKFCRYFIKNKYVINYDTFDSITTINYIELFNDYTKIHSMHRHLKPFYKYYSRQFTHTPESSLISMIDSLSTMDRTITLTKYVKYRINDRPLFNITHTDILTNNITLTYELVELLLMTKPHVLIKLFHITTKYNYCFEYITNDNTTMLVPQYRNWFYKFIIKPYEMDKNITICMFDSDPYVFNGTRDMYLDGKLIDDAEDKYKKIVEDYQNSVMGAGKNMLDLIQSID
jgi:hypothetical protein